MRTGETVDGGRLVVAPTRTPRYRPDELLTHCDASAEAGDADHAWLDDRPVGRELLSWSEGKSGSSHFLPIDPNRVEQTSPGQGPGSAVSHGPALKGVT